MAIAIRLRSPRYRDSVCTATHLSVRMTITINGTLRYTIIKDSVANQKNLFEYSELCRDYLEIEWDGNFSTLNPQQGIEIQTNIKYLTGANGTGSLVTSGVTGGGLITEEGYDSYSDFQQGYNRTIESNTPCLSNYSESESDVKTYTIYYPLGLHGRVAHMNSGSSAILYAAFQANDTSITLPNGSPAAVINIKRYHCNKYEQIAVDFVNKFGAIQREYFTLKNVEKMKVKREEFKSNIVSSTGSYSINKHTIQNFNIVGNQEITLNSDYLPEYYNQVFTELLLSDNVWVNLVPFSTNNNTAVPVNITNSDLTYKTQVNDRLINFSFSFKMSYDYINNIR